MEQLGISESAATILEDKGVCPTADSLIGITPLYISSQPGGTVTSNTKNKGSQLLKNGDAPLPQLKVKM